MNQQRREGLLGVGCLCCLRNVEGYRFAFVRGLGLEIHHLNAGGLHGGKRLGDAETIPLCAWHHRGVTLPEWTRTSMTEHYGPSWAGGSKPFRVVYGSDADLLARANALMKEAA